MARFSISVAAGALLLIAMTAVTEASTITTTTTTTFEDNPYGTDSDCYQQMMEQERLNHCGMYIMKTLGERWSFSTPRMGKREEDHKQLCCMQLKNLGEQCMCLGIEMMLHQPMWSMMDQMMFEVASMARRLPTECNLMSEPCQMRAV